MLPTDNTNVIARTDLLMFFIPCVGISPHADAGHGSAAAISTSLFPPSPSPIVRLRNTCSLNCDCFGLLKPLYVKSLQPRYGIHCYKITYGTSQKLKDSRLCAI